MSPDSAADLEHLREICMALPMAAEKLSHGAPAFFIEKGKVYAYFSHDHHGDGRTAVLLKASDRDEQAMLVEADPDSYFVPPYLGSTGWIGLRLDTGTTDWEHVAHRVQLSWEMVAPAKLRALFG